MKGSFLVTFLALVFLMGAAFAGTSGDEADSVKAATEEDASAEKLDMKVQEIFGRSCATSGCHGGEYPKMQLSLEADDVPVNMIDVPSKQNDKLMLIDTKDPSRSYVLLKMTGGEEIKGKKMPIMKKPLTEEELSTVRTWVEGLTKLSPQSAPIINKLTPSSE
jgi:mono/diheme cytochrome c family protein